MTQLQPTYRLITLGGLALVDADGRADPSLATRERELARVHMGLGEHMLALQLLERAAEIGASTVVMLNVEPAFDPLRRDVRFRSLVNRLGL